MPNLQVHPMNVDECPDGWKLHTKSPSGYLAWHEWAEKKSKTHKQKRCPTCKLFAIWVPRERRVKR